MAQDSRRLIVLCVALAWFGAACGSTSGGGGGGVAATDTTGGGSLTGKDAGAGDAAVACTPQCAGKECGDDGCGGTCGSCPSAAPVCDSATAKCKSAAPWCDGHCGETVAGQTCFCDDQCAQLGDCCLPDGTASEGKDNKKCAGSTCKLCNGTQPMCGDGTCNGTETTISCNADCKPTGPVCGNGTCEAGETTANCLQDCPPPKTCGNGVCDAGETVASCLPDCGCKTADAYCTGDTLHLCDTTGSMKSVACSDAACQAGGYVGYDTCGSNTSGIAKCLCASCTSSDEKCVGTMAYTCDAASGKLVATACGGGKVCKNATCVSPCVDECTTDNCNAAGQVELCQVGIDGCKKKLLPTACGGGLVCPPGTFSGCGVCSDQSQCDAVSVCELFTKCIPGSGATYTVTFYSATVPTTDSTGSSWDAFGGAPDPYVAVYVNDVAVGVIASASDTFSPSWGFSVDVVLKAGDVLSFKIWDEDVSSNDYIDGVQFGSWLALVKSGSYHSGSLYAGSTSTLSYNIQPK